MMNNMDVLDDIFEIYSTTSSDKLRKIIEKHFIPTKKQEKENAEIHTPVECCDEMTDKLPQEYFKEIIKLLNLVAVKVILSLRYLINFMMVYLI